MEQVHVEITPEKRELLRARLADRERRLAEYDRQLQAGGGAKGSPGGHSAEVRQRMAEQVEQLRAQLVESGPSEEERAKRKQWAAEKRRREEAKQRAEVERLQAEEARR